MISANTLLFALALVAAASGVLAWLISSTIAKAAEQKLTMIGNALSQRAATISRTAETLRTQLAELERRSPQKLAAEVAELTAAVESLRDTHRRFAGRIWQRVTRNQPDAETEWRGNGTADLDPELSAQLALQTAPPVAPGTRGA